ncbi:MAG: sulfur carrier protein ThiS [Chloroherpetonaceae bacterium]
MIKILINGKLIELPHALTLAELLKQNGISANDKGIAVAYNDEVVMKSHWEKLRVQDGDRLEIVRATQGG